MMCDLDVFMSKLGYYFHYEIKGREISHEVPRSCLSLVLSSSVTYSWSRSDYSPLLSCGL